MLANEHTRLGVNYSGKLMVYAGRPAQRKEGCTSKIWVGKGREVPQTGLEGGGWTKIILHGPPLTKVSHSAHTQTVIMC